MAGRLIILIAVLALASAGFAQVATTPGAQSQPASAATPPVPGTLLRPRRENPVVSIQEFVRVGGQMPNSLRGIGLVTGLRHGR